MDNGKNAEELVIANNEIAFLNQEKENRATDLKIAYKELAMQIEEKGLRATELAIANIELAFQNDEKEKRQEELAIANTELQFQNEEKEKRAAELIIANKALLFENQEKEKRAAELIIANKALLFENQEKEKRAAELIIANKALLFENQEKEKRAAELLATYSELQKAEADVRTLNAELEQKVVKRSAQYAFISQVNQTIVYVKDSATLFRNACNIALKNGNYTMAWIGSYNAAERKITHLNSSGISEDDIDLYTNVSFETDSPHDYVLNTGNYYLCNNIEEMPATERWMPYYKKHPNGSFIILPIGKSGKIFGTFNLYSSEINYFDGDDIALLAEVTGDISFALDVFEKEEKHKLSEIELQKNFAELEAVYEEQSAILNTLPASIALLDNKGDIVKVNDEWILFGISNGLDENYPHLQTNYIEVSEKSLGRDEKEGKKMAHGLRQILNGATDYFTMEYRCDSPTEKRWFKAEVRPFKNKLLTGAVVMHINISERKKAEAEMLLLINNTDEAFILLDDKTQIISFNSQFNKLYKEYVGLEVTRGDSYLDYVRPHRKETVSTTYTNVLQGEVEESEIEFTELSGTKYFSTKYRPAKDEFGNIFGVFITVADITEKKLAKELKEFERRNKEALINSTDDLIWSISKDFKLIAANDSFISEMKRYTGVEIKQGDDLLKVEIHSSEFNLYWKKLYTRAHNGESFKVEIYTPPVASREESWTETNFSPIIVNKAIAGIACYSRNITERKKADEKLVLTSTALQHAVNDLIKVMDSSLDVICAVDAEGNFLKVSAASETVWGYKPEELIGKPLINFVYHEDLEKTRQTAQNVMVGNNQHYFENRYVHKDGSLVPVEWAVRWDETDQIRYGVARDVSEKKRLQIAVENERQRFSDLFSEAPSSMGVLSGPDHVFEIVNPLYLQLIGKNDIIGKSIKEVLPEAADQGFFELLDGVYQTGTTFSTNEVLFQVDTHGTGQLVDRYLNLMYRAHKTEAGEIVGVLFFAIDITKQVMLRQKVEESEAKLKEAQALLHISNWEVDLINNNSTWSDEFYEILGLSHGELQPSPQSFLSMIHPDDFEYAKTKVENTFETLKGDAFSARIKKRNGQIKYIYAEWNFEFDNNAKPIRLYGILQDISERKIAEEEREKLINDLHQRNRDLEQFTFIISHNLRAPTANIIGFTEYLQDETLTNQEQKELLYGLSASVSGLDTVIRDINSILQVKRGLSDNKEKISFSKLVKDVVVSIENIIDKYDVQIKTDFSQIENIFSLNVYMHSIFYNLISNSIKYRRHNEQPLIEIISSKENSRTILTFKDNGMGIDLRKKGNKIFGLYQRFHSHVEGKGMGLFLVKSQVEAMGGKISIASEVNKGTEITIVFEN